MAKLLVKKKNGTAYIREQSEESFETLEAVHPNKVATWAAFGSVSHEAAEDGATMEEVIQAVIDEMKGKKFKPAKKKTQVTESEYQELLIQCLKKSVPKKSLDALVEVIQPEVVKETHERMVEKVLQYF